VEDIAFDDTNAKFKGANIMDALDKLCKHLGFFEKDNDQKNEGSVSNTIQMDMGALDAVLNRYRGGLK
jgi:hypothetical protein